MRTSEDRKGSQAGPLLVITAMILALSTGAPLTQTAAEAQTAAGERSAAEAQSTRQTSAPAQAASQVQARATAQAAAEAQDAARRMAVELNYALSQSAFRAEAEGTQLPQDIRIMQRIVSTALGEIEAPELPETLQGEPESAGAASSGSGGGYAYASSGRAPVTWTFTGSGGRVFNIGSREVTGFYMQGYGYLFTVNWRVAPGGIAGLGEGTAEAFRIRSSELGVLVREARRAAEAGRAEESRAAGEAERALEQERERVEERQAAWETWSAEYRDRLADGLRDVVALYGSTLNRATPEESITFIADFGGGESETVTVSARRGDLSGASRDQNLAAVRMAKGETDVSGTLRTELKIMAEIIDSSLQVQRAGEARVVYAGEAQFFGGDSGYQYVPGYGVLFRKAARLNLATRMIQAVAPSRVEPGVTVQSLRQRIEENSEEQRQAYGEHLADLKQKTAEVLATYGPTLTGMGDDEWVGVYYNVGSAAGLLEGGITDFLVQARMGDIRQAGRQADGAAWLLDRLVTNEKQDP
jgi:hypothetical protein